MGVSKLSNSNRMGLTCVLIIACFFWQAIYVALFLGGMFLADLSFARRPESLQPPLPGLNTTSTLRTQLLYEKIFFSLMLLCSILLLSQPIGGDLQSSYWPWPYLDHLIPGQWIWGGREHFCLGIGALLLVCALDCCPTLQIPFHWNFSRYLGDVSFGIYIMHFLIMGAVWSHILDPIRIVLVGWDLWGSVPFIMVLYLITLYAADLYARLDDKIVAFARFVESKLFV
jgi:peptidoglycan/LPS O-acetylase OafA/YrhL